MCFCFLNHNIKSFYKKEKMFGYYTRKRAKKSRRSLLEKLSQINNEILLSEGKSKQNLLNDREITTLLLNEINNILKTK